MKWKTVWIIEKLIKNKTFWGKCEEAAIKDEFQDLDEVLEVMMSNVFGYLFPNLKIYEPHPYLGKSNHRKLILPQTEIDKEKFNSLLVIYYDYEAFVLLFRGTGMGTSLRAKITRDILGFRLELQLA